MTDGLLILRRMLGLSGDALLAGALSGHFGLDPARAAPLLFPGGKGKPIEGLIRA